MQNNLIAQIDKSLQKGSESQLNKSLNGGSGGQLNKFIEKEGINQFFGSPFGQIGDVGDLVSLFIKISFVLAGIIILFFFILAGINMISSAGQSDPQKAEAAKKTMTSAVIGFVVVFTSYWIVKLVGQLIGIPDLI